MGIIPGGSYNNRSYLEPQTRWEIETADEILFYDAQTSGGLLMAVHPDDASALLERLRSEGYGEAAIIGEVLEPQEAALIVR